jgi:hypothetical protein
MGSQSVRFGVRSRKLRKVGQSWDGWPKIYYLDLFRASKGSLSRWSRLYLQSLARTNPHWSAWCVMPRSPYVWSIRKACALAVGALIGWWWWLLTHLDVGSLRDQRKLSIRLSLLRNFFVLIPISGFDTTCFLISTAYCGEDSANLPVWFLEIL